MKNIYTIFFLIFLLSCSESSNFLGGQYYFLIGEYDILVELDEYYISVSTTKEDTSGTLWVNDVAIPLEWEYSEYGKEWGASVWHKDLPAGLSYGLGNDYEIRLIFNGKEYTGAIHLSDKPEVEWPPFDRTEDYSYKWTLLDRPTEQSIYMNASTDEKFKEHYWHLDGSARSHTINKKYYTGFKDSDGEIDLIVDITCYNILRNKKFIILSDAWVSHSEAGLSLNYQAHVKRRREFISQKSN